MTNPLIEANVCEIGGAFYPVRLHAVPRVGELIDLFSFVDQAENHPPVKHYEVVQVVHQVRDISENVPGSMDGHHFVTVFVRSSDSEFFE